MDEKDLIIIDELKKNSRISNIELGKKIGLSDASVHNHIKKLVDLGIIKSFTINVDDKKIGWNISATMGMQIELNKTKQILEKLSSFEEVEKIWAVSGAHHLHLHTKFKDMAHMNKVISEINKIDGVRDHHSSLIIKKSK